MPRYLCRWYSNLVLLWYQKNLVIWDKAKRYMYKNPTGSGRTGWSSGFFLEVAELPIKAILPSNLMRKVDEVKKSGLTTQPSSSASGGTSRPGLSSLAAYHSSDRIDSMTLRIEWVRMSTVQLSFDTVSYLMTLPRWQLFYTVRKTTD